MAKFVKYTQAQQIAAFWSKVQVGAPDDCWPWLGGATPAGYGRVQWEGRLIGTHRLAFFLSGEYLPRKREVCHTCDNPRCCNPKHLFAGTRRQNVHDAQKKGRHIKGERVFQAKLTGSEVVRMRGLRAEGASYAELARHFKVNRMTVKDAVLGKTWKHL